MKPRLNLNDSWDLLDADDNDEAMQRNPDGSPKLPKKPPQAGKPGSGSIELYKSGWKDADMSNLTVPRCFFARSLLEQVRFHNTDLTESWLCWDNFEYCDFSEAGLIRCDMRCSYWLDCCFDSANLIGLTCEALPLKTALLKVPFSRIRGCCRVTYCLLCYPRGRGQE